MLHDLLRFQQWSVYHTFNDAISIDHGEMAASELEKGDLLTGFSEEECEWMVFAIRHHNKLAVPLDNQQKMMFAAIIRDVDKIDILRSLPPIVADHDYSPQLVEQLKDKKRFPIQISLLS